MKTIMIMFDSLNRHMLPPYGCEWVHAPNFKRLAERTATFDCSYVGSMPCMPARRELHTGRVNFLHRSWGPLEPFDDSMPEILKRNGIFSHLISDHYHYWEDGGCTYHTRYNGWEIVRGQEGDPWKTDLTDPDFPDPNPTFKRGPWGRQDWVNRAYTQGEYQKPQAQTFSLGLEFLERNHDHDNWFLQLETFDPHEPYFVDDTYRELYDFDFGKFVDDWPVYAAVSEADRAKIEHYRHLNAALISMCDHHLGRILDAMDRYDMWKDTMLIVNTDHGFLLGEHDWWAKCVMPFYNEIAHTPLFIWDPRCGVRNERRKSLVQTIDLPATILDFFGLDMPPDMEGNPLAGTIADDAPVRQAALFGLHGGHVNITDGRYVYMRAPSSGENQPLFNYTHMPTHMRQPFSVKEMQTMEVQPPFSFTKGCPTMKIKGDNRLPEVHNFTTLLFDMESDPGQQNPLHDEAVENMMIEHLIREMQANDAPPEQYARLGLRELKSNVS